MVNSTLAATFAAQLARLGPFEPSPHLAVALSGGADSMALALLTHAWVQAQGGQLSTLTVDHGLRPESAAEALQVQAWMQARGIAHHILRPEHTQAGNNLQAAARQWRYHALTGWCRTHHVLHLLVAHHAADLAETHVLQQARGITLDGAAALPCVRPLHGVRMLRPLLATAPEALRDYLRHQQQPWVEDPSNQQPRFARVRLRHALQSGQQHAPTPEALVQAATARHRQEAALAEAAYGCLRWPAGSPPQLDAAAFYALPKELGTALLANVLRSFARSATRPRRAETERAYALLQQPHAKLTLKHSVLTRQGANILLRPEHCMPPNPPPAPLPVAASPFWGLNHTGLPHI